MVKISVLPKDDRTNGWSAILPERPITPAVQGDQHADWVVIGAGFAGLAAARRLAQNRPNDKVILIEAHEVARARPGAIPGSPSICRTMSAHRCRSSKARTASSA